MNICGWKIEEYILLDCLQAHLYRLSIYLPPVCVLYKDDNCVMNQDNLPDCTVLDSGNAHLQTYTGMLEGEWNYPVPEW
jgi:hypothetical protein